MECPVCYCSTASCHLYCGHSFCLDCIKNWYTKCPDDTTCPMCRDPIYFKGIDQKMEEWDEEHYDNMFQNVFEEHLNHLLEDVNIFTMPFLKFICERLQKIREYDFDFSESDIEYFIFNEIIEEYYKDPKPISDVFTWKKMLNVSKHPARACASSGRVKGAKNRGHRDLMSEYVVYLIL